MAGLSNSRWGHARGPGLLTAMLPRPRTSGPNGALAAALPNPALAAPGDATTMGIVFLCLYLFSLFGRLPEITQVLVGTSFYQTAILGTLACLAVVISGGVQRALAARLGALLLILHIWFLVIAPFSQWRSGTFYACLFLLRYFPIAILIGGLVMTRGHFRTVILTLAASVVMDMAWIVLRAKTDSGRLEIEHGRFSNSNEIAIYLLIGLPFLLFIVLNRRFNAISRTAAAAAMIASLFVVVRTGSRGGLITIAVLFLLIWLAAPVMKKIALLLGMTVLGAILFASMSTTLRNRFATIGDDRVRDTTGAVNSTDTREALLRQSIKVTLEHPLTGVGIGVYAAAAADMSREEGTHAIWQVTHNAYTQVSAEAGIPAFVLYVSILFLCLKESYRIRKLGRLRPQFQELSLMGGCVFLSVVSFCMSGCFTSDAFDFYFYTLVGLAIGLSNVSRRELQLAPSAAPRVHLTPAPVPVGAATAPLPPSPRFQLRRDRRRRGNATL